MSTTNTTKLDLKEFLKENDYELLGPYGHEPEDEEVHYNIFDGSDNYKRQVGNLFYPDGNEFPDQGEISIHYTARISKDNFHELGSTHITLNIQQIKKALAFREVLNENNIPYKEYKKEGVDNLEKIADFLKHTNLSKLEDLAELIRNY